MSSKPSKAKRKQMAAKQHAPQAEPKAEARHRLRPSRSRPRGTSP